MIVSLVGRTISGSSSLLSGSGSMPFAPALKLAGVLEQIAGAVLGAFTNCNPGEGYGTLTLDEVFDDYFKPLDIPVFRGAQFGHIKRKFTLPIGLPVEMDAAAGTIRLLSSAVA